MKSNDVSYKRNAHDSEPDTSQGHWPCVVCGHGRHHPWHDSPVEHLVRQHKAK